MRIDEVTILSGKGGVGKTSLAAALAALAEGAVMADCDVDAADLALVLGPTLRRREPFTCGLEAVIDGEQCVGCGLCEERCRFEAIRHDGDGGQAAIRRVDPVGCEGCGVCADVCPAGAIALRERDSGEWFVSDTRFGPLVHARLRPGGENSGKLVSVVRREARRLAEETGARRLLIDGPPGIGCAAIAALAGVDLAVIVAEPTVAGVHDMERAISLTRHFKLPAMVCVNRWDMNAAQTGLIERLARERGCALAGRVGIHRAVVEAQLAGRTVIEQGGPAADDIRKVWAAILDRLAEVVGGEPCRTGAAIGALAGPNPKE